MERVEILQTSKGLRILKVFNGKRSMVYTEDGLLDILRAGVNIPGVRLRGYSGLEVESIEVVNSLQFRHPSGVIVELRNYFNDTRVLIGRSNNFINTSIGNDTLGINIVSHCISMGEPTYINIELLELGNSEYAIKVKADDKGLILCLDIFTMLNIPLGRVGDNYIVSQTTIYVDKAKELLVKIHSMLMSINGVQLI